MIIGRQTSDGILWQNGSRRSSAYGLLYAHMYTWNHSRWTFFLSRVSIEWGGRGKFFFTFLSYLALFSTHAEKKRKFVVASLTRLSQVVFCCRAADTLGAEQRGGDRAKKIKRNRRVLEERKPPPPSRELIIDEWGNYAGVELAFGGNQLKICDDNVMLRNELCDPGKRFDGGVIFGGDGGEGDFTHDATFSLFLSNWWPGA